MSVPKLSRRQLLVVGAASTGALAVAPAMGGLPAAHAADAFEPLRARWVDYLTGGTSIDETSPAIASRLSMLSDTAQDWLSQATALAPNSSIWPDLPMSGPNESNILQTYQRILDVATAWSTIGTSITGDSAVGTTLLSWYRHMSSFWYNTTISKVGNWWSWEIGIPRRLGDLSALMDTLLTSSDRSAAVAAMRRFTPNPNWRGTGTSLAETGGNRADKVLGCLLRGICARDAADMTLARDAMSGVVHAGAHSLFGYVTSGNGFYADGSYVDHDYIPYVGTYGNVALSGVAKALLLLTGSPWPVTDPDVETMLEAPQRAFAPFIWNGRMVESVRGRAVSRERERDFRNAFTTVSSMLLLAPHLGAAYRSTYRGLAKGWMQRCTDDFTTSTSATIGDLSRALAVLDDTAIAPTPEPQGHTRTASQERMIHRGDRWAFTVATSSTRIGRYEWGNGENKRGWHQGDGASYLYVQGDDDQFSDDYWPTVDPYRLAGTTASLATLSSGSGIPRAANTWGGGVSFDGRWGTAGMDLTNAAGTLRAKKSWFVIDDLILAVGSHIKPTGSPGVTVVENRGLRTGATLSVDGTPVTGSVSVTNPQWAHLHSGTDIAGYVFLQPTQMTAALVARSGTWWTINSGANTAGSSTVHSKNFATLTLAHASDVAGQTYAYVIAPRFDATRTSALAAGLDVEIIRQDTFAHIVRFTRGERRFLFAHIFAPVTSGPVTADQPVAVLAQRKGNWGTVAVSAPTRDVSTATVNVSFGHPFTSVSRADSRLTVTPGSTVKVIANLAGSRGASFETVVTL